MKTFLFSYRFEGSRYTMEVDAVDAQEASRRVHQMAGARLDGELHAKLRIPGGGWLARLFNVT